MRSRLGESVDPIYPRFAAADPLFYDLPDRSRALPPSHDEPFDVGDAKRWTGWRSHTDGPWSVWLHPDRELPDQGWKIHLSATRDSAARTLATASGYCLDRRVSFKFLRTAQALDDALSKDADRGSAGKFMTIYPTSDAELLHCLTALDSALSGADGPYILSDLRWREGPLYVRYGAFRAEFTTLDGITVPAVRNLETRQLVPDPREASFHVPDWVVTPAFLREQLDALDTTPPPDFPQVTHAIQHSNAGGIYYAERPGASVVLKEARPHAGFTPDGRDAKARLRHEEMVLISLEDRVRVPRVLGAFEAHDHRFLELERLAGTSLAKLVASTSPLTSASSERTDYRAYRNWALHVIRGLRAEITNLHAAGRAHGDLHPANVLVNDADEVSLIDFEMALPTTSEDGAVLGAPGFVGAGLPDAARRDLFTLACIELHVFLPLTPLLTLDPRKAYDLPATAATLFDLPRTWAARLSAELLQGCRPVDSIPGPPPHVRVEVLADRLLADATPERTDRLWPGDPKQFTDPPYALAHGALGVAVALQLAGSDLAPTTMAWIHGQLMESELQGAPLGLMNGLAGAHWACSKLGLSDAAERVMLMLRKGDLRQLGSGLHSGLPGVALAFLTGHNADGTDTERAVDALQELRERWAGREAPKRVTLGAGGLMGGATGTALLAVRLYERLGDLQHLEVAREALMFDLASLLPGEDGSLQVNEGWRTMPYLGTGSAGIGCVLAQYLAHAGPDPVLSPALEGLINAACVPFSSQAGLLNGRAGLMYFLALLERTGHATARTHAALQRHLRNLPVHILESGRVTGDGMLRASCDLTTGAAGVITALLGARNPMSDWCAVPHLMSPHPAMPVWGRHLSMQGDDTDGLHPVAADGREGRIVR